MHFIHLNLNQKDDVFLKKNRYSDIFSPRDVMGLGGISSTINFHVFSYTQCYTFCIYIYYIIFISDWTLFYLATMNRPSRLCDLFESSNRIRSHGEDEILSLDILS